MTPDEKADTVRLMGFRSTALGMDVVNAWLAMAPVRAERLADCKTQLERDADDAVEMTEGEQ
jgi:hypothetical protein